MSAELRDRMGQLIADAFAPATNTIAGAHLTAALGFELSAKPLGATKPVHIIVRADSVGPVAFSSDGKVFAIASGAEDCHIRLYDVGTGNQVGDIKGLTGPVRSLAFAADGPWLIAGMSDTTALVWDWRKIKNL